MPTVPPTVAAGLVNPEALHRHPHRPDDAEPSGDGYPIQQRPRRTAAQAGRVPPQDNDTERALLGAMLASPEALHAARLVLPADGGFYAGRHHRIYAAIAALDERAERADLVSVTHELRRRGDLGEAGGATYLSELTTAYASIANAGMYARVVAEHAMKRRYIETATLLVGKAYDPASDAFDLLEDASRDLAAIAAQVSRGNDHHVSHAVEQALGTSALWRRGEAPDVVRFGLRALDRALLGMYRSEVTLLAGLSGSGKTAFLGQIVMNIARTNAAKRKDEQAAVMVVSAEMTAEQLVQRAAAAASGVNLVALRAGTASDEQYEAYEAALARLHDLPLYIDDTPAPSLAHINAKAYAIVAKHPGGIDLIAVDYDEKLSEPESRSEELRVSRIAQGMKDVAKRHRAAVLLLSQYNRQSADPKSQPQDSWLRYSDKKKQESATVMHWWWPGYWVGQGHDPLAVLDYNPEQHERGWMLVTKGRHGGTDKIPLDFQPHLTRFVDPYDPLTMVSRYDRDRARYEGGDDVI